ncbi:hypothetical protein E2C01_010853 [Portunus trituberculatus]|uniref:Uncharacterized protein n=1 Tax=Portunus trituberculatus TaxID=210409 RepID=A0A5B7D9Q2_PORTR|nr:hypothetical protein [Portunus trituberculatus]
MIPTRPKLMQHRLTAPCSLFDTPHRGTTNSIPVTLGIVNSIQPHLTPLYLGPQTTVAPNQPLVPRQNSAYS